jgi:hypothetical protein
MSPAVYTREPTLAQLLIGPMHNAQQLLRQEVALAKHEMRAELGNTLRAGMSLGLGVGIAAIGGWLLILMVVHLLHALTAVALWVCYGIVAGLCAAGGIALLVLGKQKLADVHLAPQETVETMRENVQWITAQVRANGTPKSSGQR